jgi:hypothetical protein
MVYKNTGIGLLWSRKHVGAAQKDGTVIYRYRYLPLALLFPSPAPKNASLTRVSACLVAKSTPGRKLFLPMPLLCFAGSARHDAHHGPQARVVSSARTQALCEPLAPHLHAARIVLKEESKGTLEN